MGRTVKVALPSGAVPKGRVIGVEFDRLVLDIKERGPVAIERGLRIQYHDRPHEAEVANHRIDLSALGGLGAGAAISNSVLDAGLASPEGVATAYSTGS